MQEDLILECTTELGCLSWKINQLTIDRLASMTKDPIYRDLTDTTHTFNSASSCLPLREINRVIFEVTVFGFLRAHYERNTSVEPSFSGK